MINGAFTVIAINGKFLFLKRLDKGLWDLPGGGFEPSEIAYREVTRREIKEETGLALQPDQIQLCGILGQRLKKSVTEQHGGIEKGLIFLHCAILYNDCTTPPPIIVGNEHSEFRLFTYEEIIAEYKDFSSGPLAMFFTYLLFQQTNKVQEGMLSARIKWKGKDYSF